MAGGMDLVLFPRPFTPERSSAMARKKASSPLPTVRHPVPPLRAESVVRALRIAKRLNEYTARINGTLRGTSQDDILTNVCWDLLCLILDLAGIPKTSRAFDRKLITDMAIVAITQGRSERTIMKKLVGLADGIRFGPKPEPDPLTPKTRTGKAR
jgi:hypothetical protein